MTLTLSAGERDVVIAALEEFCTHLEWLNEPGDDMDTCRSLLTRLHALGDA